MTAKIYRYTVEGKARNDQTWVTTGHVCCDFHEVFGKAMRFSFNQITEGKAVFGRPTDSCQGPYDVTKFLIEQVKEV